MVLLPAAMAADATAAPTKPFADFRVPIMSFLRVTTGLAGGPASPEKTTRAERHRRRLGEAMLHAPQTLRALVRADEIWLVVLAAGIGIAAGLLVVAMTQGTQLLHELLFGIDAQQRLSSEIDIDPIRALLVPTLGGLALGLSFLGLARWWPNRAVDPIEANALYGGTMSLIDSLIVVYQTILSNGFGSSVGLEAGYTQIGSAIGSRLGRSFRVRRNDLRLLVGCGAAGAIAAAFDAPLTGSFYGFELVIGTYSLATLAPVVAASLCAVAVSRLLTGGAETFDLLVPGSIEAIDYVPILALGIVCALGGIAIMRGVTLTEMLFRRSRVPIWARPAIGGLLVGGLALISPQVLSSGHGALRAGLDAPYTLSHVAVLILLKAAASAISIGSGFRGGLFFASLFLGALLGKLFAGVLAMVTVSAALPTVVCALVGMSALAVAVVGGPLTMAFLALETTGSLPMTVAVLAASVVSSLTVRRTFGYSFATWRFHLRGEAIRSAVDVGWMRNLTVGRMMRREVRSVRADLPINAFRREFPLGAEQRVVALDESGRYAGIVQVAEAHGVGDKASRVGDVLHYPRTLLLPQMTVKEAMSLFEAAESDALVVVDGAESKRVIGILTEQHALRRYSDELDRRRRELSGE
jgi:CIC family chloride channel protein